MANYCEYFPCHKNWKTEYSCEFCKCPEYEIEKCSGTPEWIETRMGKVKDCSCCVEPHKPEYVREHYRRRNEDKKAK